MRFILHRFAPLRIAGALAAVLLWSALGAPGAALEQIQPPTRTTGDPTAGAAVASDHPAATEAAWEALRQGGSAVDAALAAAFVLSVAMPEAASLAAGGAALRYDIQGRHVSAYVGREVAGAAVDPSWLDTPPDKRPRTLDSGRAVGAPTLMQMFRLMHDAGGRLDWSALTRDAERLARAGAPLTPATAEALAQVRLPRYGGAEALFGGSGDAAPGAGAPIRNPELADVLQAIGRDGPEVLTGGIVGQSIAQQVGDARRRPATLTLDDLGAARAVVAPPACIALARAALCAPPAPTIGPAVLETAALFAAAAPAEPSAFDWANVMAQSHRHAMADMRRFLGDPLVFPDLTPELLEPGQIARRAEGVRLDRDRGLPGSARVRGMPRSLAAAVPRVRRPPTASVVAVDGKGDAVALSITLSRAFGSGLAARGVILNAANSSFEPRPGPEGLVRANQVAPGARPRLDVAPVMALDGERRLLLAAAASGGADAPAYLAKAATAVLGFGMSAEAAIAAPNVASSGRATYLEAQTGAERLERPLADIGHAPRLKAMPSGLVVAVRSDDGYDAAADSRGVGSARRKSAKEEPAARAR